MDDILVICYLLIAALVLLIILSIKILKDAQRERPDEEKKREVTPSKPVISKEKPRNNRKYFDWRGFDHNHIHRNGTKYDDYGYDYYGYNALGYNRQGYNHLGKNAKGQYDRRFDTFSSTKEGFLDPEINPVVLSTHAKERFQERLGIFDVEKMQAFAEQAYRFGKSKRQIKPSSAYLVEELEQKYDESVILIYKGYIYIFSLDNVLKTVYKNERIPL